MISKLTARILFVSLLVFLPLEAVSDVVPETNVTQATVIFGGDANYPPFHFINGQGLPAGFDVELFTAIAETMEIKVEFELGDWAIALADLELGIIDVVPMFVSDKRKLRYDFSQPYTMGYHLIYGHEDSLPIGGFDQLGGKEVIFRRSGYIGESLQKAGIDVLPVITNTELEILSLLASGKYDYGLLPEITARNAIQKYNLTSLRIVGPPILAENYGFAVKKGNVELISKLNEGLRLLKQTGQYEPIYNRWFTSLESLTEIKHDLLSTFLWVLLPLFLILLVSLAFSKKLTSKVKWQKVVLSTERKRRREAEELAQYLAYNDKLTALPNRNQFTKHLEEVIDDARVNNKKFAVYSFKFMNLLEINQSGGYEIGNQLLKIIGNDLKKHFGANACTISPGRFAVLIESAQDANDMHEKFQLFLAQFNQPRLVEGVSVDLRFRTGFALYPDDGTNAEILIRNAELAQTISHDMDQTLIGYTTEYEPDPRNLTLMADLRLALQETKQIKLFCQPKLDLRQRTITGGEILVRWQHPKYGELTPNVFIPLAEKFGLIRELTLYVIKETVSFMETHFTMDERLKLSVNISVKDFTSPDFSAKVISLASCWLKHLILEITETAAINDPRNVLNSVAALQKENISLSIDDFGTGYSSLSYLKQLNPFEIKIDRLFVKGLTTSADDRIVVASTIKMAHDLGMQVVAEGPEDAETLRLLSEMNCDIAQGYGIAKPMDINDFWVWVKRPDIINF